MHETKPEGTSGDNHEEEVQERHEETSLGTHCEIGGETRGENMKRRVKRHVMRMRTEKA